MLAELWSGVHDLVANNCHACYYAVQWKEAVEWNDGMVCYGLLQGFIELATD